MNWIERQRRLDERISICTPIIAMRQTICTVVVYFEHRDAFCRG